MHVLDDGGGEWWQVDVVLRPPVARRDLNDALLQLVRAASSESPDAPARTWEPRNTSSYDMHPPEGNLGVAIWVRAPDIGRAVSVACETVTGCASALFDGSDPELWDIRALPYSAVLDRRPTSRPLTWGGGTEEE